MKLSALALGTALLSTPALAQTEPGSSADIYERSLRHSTKLCGVFTPVLEAVFDSRQDGTSLAKMVSVFTETPSENPDLQLGTRLSIEAVRDLYRDPIYTTPDVIQRQRTRFINEFESNCVDAYIEHISAKYETVLRKWRKEAGSTTSSN